MSKAYFCTVVTTHKSPEGSVLFTPHRHSVIVINRNTL